MCQYGTILAHAERLGAKPVLSDTMKTEMLKHFPNLKMPSESEITECSFNWTDIETNGTNMLDVADVQVIHIHCAPLYGIMVIRSLVYWHYVITFTKFTPFTRFTTLPHLPGPILPNVDNVFI